MGKPFKQMVDCCINPHPSPWWLKQLLISWFNVFSLSWVEGLNVISPTQRIIRWKLTIPPYGCWNPYEQISKQSKSINKIKGEVGCKITQNYKYIYKTSGKWMCIVLLHVLEWNISQQNSDTSRGRCYTSKLLVGWLDSYGNLLRNLLKFTVDFPASERMNPSDFNDPMSFLFTQPPGQTFHIFASKKKKQIILLLYLS